jgi:hypothetical protein
MKKIKVYPLFYIFILAALCFIFIQFKFTSQPFMKGMTISCQTWGNEWATPQMKNTLIELKSLGINWFAIHPYARIRDNGSVSFRNNSDQYHITTPLEWAKELDMKVMLKPHLAYWGSGFSWRGDINFTTSQDWQRFFNDYKVWMVMMAKIAQEKNAEVLCIGTEYRHATQFEQEWRSVISAVRSVYQGELTYGANWDTYNSIEFWDALDYIGIQAYFPLVKKEIPTEENLISAWNQVYSELIPYSRKLQKGIIFTEIGYSSSFNAAEKPWSPYDSHSKEARKIQELCLKVALDQSIKQENLAGIFLWKWFPETPVSHHYENYNLQIPEIKALIKDMWD